MAAAGIGPGRTPGVNNSGNAAGYLKALGLGARLLDRPAIGGSAAIWTGYTPSAVVGSWGTDYLVRAVQAENTLGTQVPGPSRPLRCLSRAGRSGTATISLTGTRSYEIRFAAGDLPPHGADGFWSITLYNAAGSLVANPISGRFSIGDHTPGLLRGADGSVTIVMSPGHPSEAHVNWLPAPKGSFSLVLRVYEPAPQVLDGSWSPPAIRAIG